MAILKPGQLASGSYTISGSFSGSFQGSGAGLNNIPSSAIVGLSSTQIASGAVSASVSTGTGSFTVTSGSSTFMFISSSGNVGVGTTTPSRLLHVSEGGTRLSQTFNPGVPTLYVYHGRTETDSTVRFENASGDQLYFGGNGLFVTGNTTIGNGSTTLSARLGVKGSGTTSATTALLVQNSNSETTIIAKNDRTIGLGRSAFTGEGYGGIAIGYPNVGNLQYSSYDAHTFNVFNGASYETALLIKGNGASSRVLIGPSSDTTYKFQVSGSNSSGSVNLDNTLYVSGSRVGIGTSTPQGAVHIATATGTPAFVLSDVGAPNTLPTLQFRRGPLSAYSLQLDFPSNIKARFQIGDAITGYEITGGNIGLTGGKSIEFGGVTGQTATGIIGSIQTDNNNGQLLFSTRGSGTTAERARITNTGNVLINTTTDAGFRLDVNGTARVQGNAQFGTGFYWDNTNNRLGINTSSPFSVLDVSSSALTNFQRLRTTNTGATTNVALRIQDGTTGFTETDGLYLGRSAAINYLWTYESEPLAFGTSNFERMRIDTSGNVGIGTTNFWGSLQLLVVGPNSTEGRIGASSTDRRGVFLGQVLGTSQIFAYDYIANAARFLAINSFGGNVGINTTTDAGFRLDVNGTARVSDNVLLTNGIIATSTATTRLQSSLNFFSHQRLASSGAFGFDIRNSVGTQCAFWTYDAGSGNINFGGSTSAGGLLFTTNGLTRATVTFDGNTLINTTTDTGHRLTVSGSGASGSVNLDNTLYVSGSRVGVGMSNPAYNLDISGSARLTSTSATRFLIDTTNASPNTGFGLSSNNTLRWSNAAYRPSGTNLSYVIFNDQTGTDSLFIQGDTNNVIIGSSTDAGFKLDVNGTARIQGNTTVTGTIGIGSGASFLSLSGAANNNVIQGTQTIEYRSGGSSINRAYHNFTNSLTFNPTADFIPHVNMAATFAPTSGTGTYTQLFLYPTINQTGGANGITRGLHIQPTLTAAPNFRAIETTTGSVILNGGNVGIGTSTPSASLHISGSSGSALFEIDSPALNNILFVTGSGRVGIGTGNPARTLDIQSPQSVVRVLSTTNTNSCGLVFNNFAGDFWIGRDSSVGNGFGMASPAYAGVINARGNYPLYIGRNDSNDISIFTTGNIGINTTTDAGYKLDVNGTARVSGVLTCGNNVTAANFIGNIRSDLFLTSNGGFYIFQSSGATGNAKFNQFVSIGTNSEPVASAALDVVSTTKGFLPPRMTGAQAELISSPAEGLMVYATDGTGVTITSKGWWGYDGATWVKFN